MNENSEMIPESLPFGDWPRLCRWCQDPNNPLPENADKHVKYHPECKAEHARVKNLTYYMANAEKLRVNRRLAYKRRKAQRKQ